MNLIIFASGRGSNFAAIADAIAQGRIQNARIRALISNNPGSNALQLAAQRQIPTEVVPWKEFRTGTEFDRSAYEKALVAVAKKYAPDLICLAGYTLLVGKTILNAWPNRMINIHPSLLPAFKGLRAQKQALEYGVKWTGCTVHFVNEELDAGPIIAQSAIEVRDDDTEETLVQRLLPVEHETYIEALRKLCSRKHRIEGRRLLWEGAT